jgi:hypothetical protein
MNQDSLGLIIFALIALGAVFAFIFVFGGPAETGALSGTQKIGTSWYKVKDAYQACGSGSHCSDGLPGLPTGNYDQVAELFECKCQTKDPAFVFYRSKFSPG